MTTQTTKGNTMTALDELIDLCSQADRADGKVVPILPAKFFTEVAFALSNYKDMCEGKRKTIADIDRMTNRFLCWRLPQPWNPDNGISYKRPNYAHAPADHDWPTGTNLFDYSQAKAMIEHMLGDDK